MEGYVPRSSEISSLSAISLATQIVCIGALTFFVSLRYVAKYRLKLPFWLDDVFCAVAYFFYMGHCACSLAFTYLAGPIPAHNNLTPSQMEAKYRVFYIAAFFYVPMILFSKLTLLFLLIRIFQTYREKVIYVYVFVVLITSYYVAILFVKVFICSPIRAFWQDWRNNDSKDQCLNRPAVFLADSSISVVTDIAILIFPIALTWSLHMPVTKKIGVVAILGAGCIAVAFSMFRLILVAQEYDSPHQVSLILKILLTDNAEGGLGLICACLPAFNKFVHHLLRLRAESRHASGKQQNNSSEVKMVKSSKRDESPARDESLPSASPVISASDA